MYYKVKSESISKLSLHSDPQIHDGVRQRFRRRRQALVPGHRGGKPLFGRVQCHGKGQRGHLEVDELQHRLVLHEIKSLQYIYWCLLLRLLDFRARSCVLKRLKAINYMQITEL